MTALSGWRYWLCVAGMTAGVALGAHDGWLAYVGGFLVGISFVGAYYTGRYDDEAAVQAEAERLRAENKRLRRLKASDDGAYEHVVEMYHAEAAEVVQLRAHADAAVAEIGVTSATYRAEIGRLREALTAARDDTYRLEARLQQIVTLYDDARKHLGGDSELLHDAILGGAVFDLKAIHRAVAAASDGEADK